MVHLKIATSIYQSQVADLLPCNNSCKSSLTFALLRSYGLLELFDEVIETSSCTGAELKQFHSKDYVNLLLDPKLNASLDWESKKDLWNHFAESANHWLKDNEENPLTLWHTSKRELYEEFPNSSKSTTEQKTSKFARWGQLLADSEEEGENSLDDVSFDGDAYEKALEEHGLLYDCHVFSYLPLYCQVTTGATLALAKNLKRSDQRSISINWDGGRHHALKSKANGFCYVNDIVLLIQRARRQGLQRITYIDFDLHHGDGVERAFRYSTNVQTISLHLYEQGFFPGTGSTDDAKSGKNVFNIPLRHGLDDKYLSELTERVVVPCASRNEPELVVIQCGGDGLIGDKYKEWQLSIKGLTKSIMRIVDQFSHAHIVLLGGGGYNERVMSRFYTYLTWSVVEKFSNHYAPANPFLGVDDVMPDHEFIDLYKDEFYKFWFYDLEGTSKKSLKNNNTPDYIDQLCELYNI
ncbi:LAFE_0D09054g1_1 [Lachancea fermentati]|uniref:histone deacetylase n=1 Tax=Lachancea fermentati TaxID=4955 RepID=A0A1G4MBJ9_LACFM|nr:LAFE_0D09054g1_1 [Lachancea fermentati]